MQHWNVVVTVHEHHFKQACRLLDTYGRVARTEYFNVLTMQVDDIGQFIRALHQQLQTDPSLAESVARVMPAQCTFIFQSPAEFETRAETAVLPWHEKLAGKHFHVRMHRRGFKGRMASQEEERFLDHALMQALSTRGATAQVDFDDPDFIIAVETVGQDAGISLWSREELKSYPLLKLD
jgi:tRNA(Ser,Leu) C12 N-acetylase TAN1